MKTPPPPPSCDTIKAVELAARFHYQQHCLIVFL